MPLRQALLYCDLWIWQAVVRFKLLETFVSNLAGRNEAKYILQVKGLRMNRPYASAMLHF